MSTGEQRTLRIGTRGSQLAQWQARAVADLLERGGNVTCELVAIKTSGDQLAEASLSEAGGKRLFVREIEEALIDGRVDLAVHSAKDMPVAAVDGLVVAAVLPREEPWDAIVLPASSPIVFRPGAPIEDIVAQIGLLSQGGLLAQLAALSLFSSSPGTKPAAGSEARVATQKPGGPTFGTSSVRRVAQLRRLVPGATFSPIRGNLDTRLRKLDEGHYDLLVLAAAGLKRLGAGDRVSARLPVEACVPAPGQGVIAVQVRADDQATRTRVAAINDAVTAKALVAEQAVVEALGGGCQTPIGALAVPARGDRLDVHAIVTSLDGQRALRSTTSGPAGEAQTLGRRAAADLLSRGAAALLEEASGPK